MACAFIPKGHSIFSPRPLCLWSEAWPGRPPEGACESAWAGAPLGTRAQAQNQRPGAASEAPVPGARFSAELALLGASTLTARVRPWWPWPRRGPRALEGRGSSFGGPDTVCYRWNRVLPQISIYSRNPCTASSAAGPREKTLHLRQPLGPAFAMAARARWYLGSLLGLPSREYWHLLASPRAHDWGWQLAQRVGTARPLSNGWLARRQQG